jgi:energy-coupling factor transporter ATP-binding protein EcfA2
MTKVVIAKLSGSKASLVNLSGINVILGRNGSGKSRLLRDLDAALSGQKQQYNCRYISPERGGAFQRNGNIETNLISGRGWLEGQRRKNQAENFRAASRAFLRDVETTYLRKLQNTDARDRSFQNDILGQISRLLTNVTIEQDKADFVFRTIDGETVGPDDISSGETEAISLASEILYFFQTIDTSKSNILLLDEPDVHQHPDLQARLGQFLIDQLEELQEVDQNRVAVCIATHSAPFVCSLAASDFTSLGTKEFRSNDVALAPTSSQLKKIAPFFGHPLSLTLSNDVMLILEGEDDERVWQQAGRSSQGRIRVFPVVATSVDQQTELERFCEPILRSLYDSPLAYSLRDGDGKSGPLEHCGPVLRFRLDCYAIENALVTTESLAILDLTWDRFRDRARIWISANPAHRDARLVTELIDSPDRLRNHKIKDIRQLIVAMSGSNKPWEVVVGQALASTADASGISADPFAMIRFIGADTAKALLKVE